MIATNRLISQIVIRWFVELALASPLECTPSITSWTTPTTSTRCHHLAVSLLLLTTANLTAARPSSPPARAPAWLAWSAPTVVSPPKLAWTSVYMSRLTTCTVCTHM
ncbi:hypothetical protein C8Q80DRAFT_579656 [Daedaleopsis nitida]|nr:hypothetical protein C8Q80DRAFT_579656 [Daedaleopsis nitida]